MPTRALTLLLVLLLTVQLLGCAVLGARSPGEPSTAHADTQDTRLARIAEASLSGAPSGFRLLPRGEFAFDAPMALAKQAERSIDAQYHHLQPDGTGRDPGPTMGRQGAAMQGVLDAMAGARREVSIMSPYFVTGPVGMRAMSANGQQGVRVTLFTNSLASSDEPLAHHWYAGYCVAMLRLGVQIYEFSPELVQRSGGFGFKGPTSARLHAKVAVVDDRLLVVGSVDLDPRSAIANTETRVVIDSPLLAAELLRLSESKAQRAMMYRLRLHPDGRTVEWLTCDEQGRVVATTDEPGSSPWLQLKLWLQSLLVDERLL